MRVTTTKEMGRTMTVEKKHPLFAKVIGSILIGLITLGAFSGLILLIVMIWRVIL